MRCKVRVLQQPFDEFDAEETRINAIIASSVVDVDSGEFGPDDILKFKADPIRAHISDVSCVLDPETLCSNLNDRIAQSKFSEAMGSTIADENGCDLFDAVQQAVASAFSASVGAAHVTTPKGVSAETLQKVFRIDLATAKRTLKVTTQLNSRNPHSSLSRGFGTNDRMLRYRRINSYFFTDTFFVTKKAKVKEALLA